MCKELSVEQKKSLLSLARELITARFSGKSVTMSEEQKAITQIGGVFVTLHLAGNLRGCIGLIESALPITESIREMAVEAAFGDPRFGPLSLDELSAIDIEISVLTPPVAIESIDEISLGRDGIIFENGRRRSLFLPQVATEQEWDLDTTLMHLALKAGMSPEAWRESTARFKTFQSIYFSETELNMR